MSGAPLAAYAAGVSRVDVEAALRAAGADPEHLAPADLALLEDFHTLGRFATVQLAELAEVQPTDRVLDAGSGLGGTARYLAAQYGCTVTAVELSESYCATARWLNRAVGLDHLITVTNGDVTRLPFPDGSFDLVVFQHVQMNVADKAGLYREARRVLAPGGRVALWEVTGASATACYPLPWAEQARESHLVGSEELRQELTAAGLEVERWTDLTATAAPLMAGFLAQPAGPLGLQVYVADFATKAANLARGLEDGSLRVVQALAVRPPAGNR